MTRFSVAIPDSVLSVAPQLPRAVLQQAAAVHQAYGGDPPPGYQGEGDPDNHAVLPEPADKPPHTPETC